LIFTALTFVLGMTMSEREKNVVEDNKTFLTSEPEKLSVIVPIDKVSNYELINSKRKEFFKVMEIPDLMGNFVVPRIYANKLPVLSDEMVKVVYEVNLAGLNPKQIGVLEKKLNIDTNNMVFVGNSLVEGLRLYSESNNVFLCKVGIDLKGLKSDIYKKLKNYSCETVVIGMGTNELGYYNEEVFKNSYKDLIEYVRSINPETNIICLSIPPVSEKKSNSSDNFNNYNVKKYNGYIQDIIAEDTSLLFVDNKDFFGEVLSTDFTGDGIHLRGKVYQKWYQYIIEKISEF